jgi:hypothetical protein
LEKSGLAALTFVTSLKWNCDTLSVPIGGQSAWLGFVISCAVLVVTFLRHKSVVCIVTNCIVSPGTGRFKCAGQVTERVLRCTSNGVGRVRQSAVTVAFNRTV